MGDTSIAYRQGDYPVSVDGSFATRVQDFELMPEYPRTRVDQLGSSTSVGVIAESTDYTGRIRAYGIDNSIETAFGGATPIAWQGASGVDVAGPTYGLTGAKIMRAEYSCRVGGFFEESFDIFGTGESSGSPSITATTTGDAAYMAKDISVEVNGTAVVRAQSFRATVDCRPTVVREFNNSDIVGRVYDSPATTLEIEFLESTSIAGNTEFTSSAGSIVVKVNTSSKVLTFNNVRSVQTPRSGRVGDFGRRVYRYESDGDTDDGGLTLS